VRDGGARAFRASESRRRHKHPTLYDEALYLAAYSRVCSAFISAAEPTFYVDAFPEEPRVGVHRKFSRISRAALPPER
jgi:hypothetical protein